MLSYLVCSCQTKESLYGEAVIFVTEQAFVTSDAFKSGFLAYTFMHAKTALSTTSLRFESMSSKIHRLVSLPSYKLLLWGEGPGSWPSWRRTEKLLTRPSVTHVLNSRWLTGICFLLGGLFTMANHCEQMIGRVAATISWTCS